MHDLAPKALLKLESKGGDVNKLTIKEIAAILLVSYNIEMSKGKKKDYVKNWKERFIVILMNLSWLVHRSQATRRSWTATTTVAMNLCPVMKVEATIGSYSYYSLACALVETTRPLLTLFWLTRP